MRKETDSSRLTLLSKISVTEAGLDEETFEKVSTVSLTLQYIRMFILKINESRFDRNLLREAKYSTFSFSKFGSMLRKSDLKTRHSALSFGFIFFIKYMR